MNVDFAPAKRRRRLSMSVMNKPVNIPREPIENFRRQRTRLAAAWNQLIREIRTPVRRSARGVALGATAQSYRDVRAKRSELNDLLVLWRPWMGTFPYTIGEEPYANDRSLTTGQNEAKVTHYQNWINTLTVLYNKLYRDWGLSFQSLFQAERVAYADDIQRRVDAAAGEAISEEAGEEEGVTRHSAPEATPVSLNPDLDAAATATYSKGKTSAETKPDILQYLPAVGIGLTAFKLFFSK